MNLGHVAAGFLALTLVVPAGAAAPLIDQIDNGGFEDDLAEWRVVDGDVSADGVPFEGSGAAKLNAVGGTTTTTLAQEVSLDNDDAPIVPNAEYEIAFAAVLNDGSENSAAASPDVFGQIVWKNALGETTDVDRVEITDTDDYVEYSQTFDAPEDATAADIQFHVVRENLEDPTDANLQVDAVAFGPADPTGSV
ncbi:hypothetical protein BRD56_11845 [Thermoplasmatales archaeon SW_10_69_26]|nr:MAG: hypothetical protein BRD56_11845 [Thermoplasmatales archaeon SW_10_69_26]